MNVYSFSADYRAFDTIFIIIIIIIIIIIDIHKYLMKKHDIKSCLV